MKPGSFKILVFIGETKTDRAEKKPVSRRARSETGEKHALSDKLRRRGQVYRTRIPRRGKTRSETLGLRSPALERILIVFSGRNRAPFFPPRTVFGSGLAESRLSLFRTACALLPTTKDCQSPSRLRREFLYRASAIRCLTSIPPFHGGTNIQSPYLYTAVPGGVL